MGEHFVFLTTRIAGLLHHVHEPVENVVTPGEDLHLVREPDNSFDPNAVRIDTRDGVKLGYIPAQEARLVAALIDHGYPVACRVLNGAGKDAYVQVTLPDRS